MLARASRPAARLASCLSAGASPRYASTLVLGEHNAAAVSSSTLAAITAAKRIGGEVTVLLAGKGSGAAASSARSVDGVSRVLTAEDPALDAGLAENMSKLLLEVQSKHKFSHIVAVASNYGKNITPRVAAKLDVAPISDVTAVHDEATFDRPMYAGNAIAKVKSADAVKVLTVRPTAFEKAKGGSGSAPVEAVAGAWDAGKAKFVSEERTKSERPELTAASIVVAGGRALKSGENFKILYDLADKLGAGVGASRAAVDAGYVPNDMQVGQTGKVVAPNLYIAAGISGAIQHLAGMKDSKVIVAINKDAEAPIFQVADYGLVEDLFKAVPEMTAKLPAKH